MAEPAENAKSLSLAADVGYLAAMRAFETVAVLDDASHLTLRQSLPEMAGRECRVIVLFERPEAAAPAAWPPGFFDEVRVTDPAFLRPEQGETPPEPKLEAV